MEPARQKKIARVVLVAFAALCAGWLARLDYARKISTNVLDLLPSAEQSPEAGVVRSLASDAQVRVMLFALRDSRAPDAPPHDAARAFAAELMRSGVFAAALPVGDEAAQDAMGRAVFEQRFKLLLPTWLADQQRAFTRTGQPAEFFSAWLAERAAGELETFLAKPEAVALQELVPSDPLLLVPRLLERASLLAATTNHAGGRALIWAQIKASPLDEEGQGPVFAAIEQAQAKVRTTYPDLELRWTGVNRFAAASRQRIEAELGLLNTVSIIAVLGVGCLFVRRLWKMLHLLPVILISLLGAWTVTTLVFDRTHVLVFVIGSLLSGVAIDYGFYIYLQPSRRPDESYAEKLRRLLKPLLASCLTTVIGFSLLTFSDLPLLREVGVFVGAGLLCALAAAMLYFAQLERPFLETRDFGRSGDVRENRRRRHALRAIFVLALGVALAGPWWLHWRDDIRQLEIPSPELQANERLLRGWFGDTAERSIFLTHGATVAQARQRLENFIAHLERTNPRAHAASLGLVFPTEANWEKLPERLNALGHFETDFRAALERHGFSASSFEGFFSAWHELRALPSPVGDYAALYAEFGKKISGPPALLLHVGEAMSWFLTMADESAPGLLPPELHTLPLNQLESLNNLFTRYRWSALRLSVAGLALVIASVFAIYRGWSAVRIALIPAGSCFFVFGVLGLLGQTLNLFHLLGAFLGVCLSHNYAIFSAETAATGRMPPVSIRLSALCTAASFGVLGFSRIPVIHALGMTVALIVLTALAAVELEPLARRTAA